MCTLSWVPDQGGYTLAFNRDERGTRATGTPPKRVMVAGVPVLMPRDPDGGGSWISVNALGHTLALLNRYEDTPSDVGGAYRSRGGLVTGLAEVAGAAVVEASLRSMELGRYRPFTLASVAKRQQPTLFEWDGRTLQVAEVSNPGLVRASSGSDQAGAERSRAAVFSGFGSRLTGGDLLALHRSHAPEKGALSICMHRDDAMTVSLSYITVTGKELLFRYVGRAPCETAQMTTLAL